MSESLLTAVRARVAINVDSMDPVVAQTHAAAAAFVDMTSNQAIAHGEAKRAEQAAAVAAAVAGAANAEAGADSKADLDAQVTAAIDFLTVHLAKNVLPHLSPTGHVHAQTSPSTAHDTTATLTHARALVTLFAAHGIPRERVCIKIPATPAGITACTILEHGSPPIRTLATCVFSVPQALAAAQAGCLYVAPYFNELPVHFTEGLWKSYGDAAATAREHPMAPVIHSIVAAYKATGAKTLVMPASIVTAEEVLALVSLQPDHLTLSGAVLAQLAALPAASLPEPLPLPNAASSPLDYLADSASALGVALAADTESARKLADALRIFTEQEDALRALLRAQLASA